jgi:hypothetical protein
MKYPIATQNFEKIRNDRYVYVYKTAFISQLALSLNKIGYVSE